MSPEQPSATVAPVEEQKKLSKLEKDYAGFRATLDRVFTEHPTPEARLKDLQIDTISAEKFKFVGIDQEQFKIDLAEAVQLETQDAFRETLFALGKPFIDTRHAHPKEYEALEREQFLKKDGLIPVNQLLAYGIGGSHLHLHAQPNQTTSLREKLVLFNDGLTAIAKIVDANPEIETIGGTSWLVGEHPGFMESHGFTVSELDEKQKKFYDYEKRKVADAMMTRDEFLKKYLLKK